MSERLPVRASDAERERVVAALREHCAAGRLTLEEFSQRAETVYAASTREELAAVTADLPEQQAEPRSRKRPKRLTLSIFGGADRRGRWRVPRRGLVLSAFGGSDLDLRQAELDAAETTFVAVSIFGGTDFYVPEGVEVDLTGFALFGGNDERGDEGRIHPGAPLVRVVALSLFGGCDVWHTPRGASGGKRELRRAARRADREP